METSNSQESRKFTSLHIPIPNGTEEKEEKRENIKFSGVAQVHQFTYFNSKPTEEKEECHAYVQQKFQAYHLVFFGGVTSRRRRQRGGSDANTNASVSL